ncbi:MAG TPA: hypothetical protein VMF35_12480 [Acidimicrobiales bacterium]|nr:hypothetical protein [Acidimicrobiales bacterium]
MNDDPIDAGCDKYSDELAELALGVLTGRERALALSHVESCQRCADELEQLSRVADTVVQVAPEVEPPMGFEVRLFEKMGVSDELAPRRTRKERRERAHRHRSRSVRWGTAAVAVAAAAAVALGLGLSLPSSNPPTESAHGTGHARGQVESAHLVQNGENVGRVAVFGGKQPWMSMMLTDDSSVRGTVNCVVVTKDGARHHVGTFTVSPDGYGAWIAPLDHVDPADVRTAEVVSPSGTVLATATLS